MLIQPCKNDMYVTKIKDKNCFCLSLAPLHSLFLHIFIIIHVFDCYSIILCHVCTYITQMKSNNIVFVIFADDVPIDRMDIYSFTKKERSDDNDDDVCNVCVYLLLTHFILFCKHFIIYNTRQRRRYYCCWILV